VRPPSALEMTTGLPPSKTETQLFVVPRSIPITFDIIASSVKSFCKSLAY
jgi:hypothetical protein